MKKKIFKVYLEQYFDEIDYDNGDKWYKRGHEVIKRASVVNFEKYILANDLEEAIEKYRSRYDCDGFDSIIDYRYLPILSSYPQLSKTPNFTYEVKGFGVSTSFDVLKSHMRSDEFLEYCKQEMYPIEVILSK